jgi:hypothetical protein
MKIIIDSQQINQSGENIKIDLQNVIDNRNGEYVIFPKEISYYVGYFNISNALGNNGVTYSNGTRTTDVFLPDGLYTLHSYFNIIKLTMNRVGDNVSGINYFYSDCDGKITVYVKPPYTFTISDANMNLLGFTATQIITSNKVSNNPVNFLPHKMLYIHLKQLKNNNIYFNGNKSDILAKVWYFGKLFI